jgi:hypothetical protein
MFTTYRTHQEQISSIARTLRDFYYIRRTAQEERTEIPGMPEKSTAAPARHADGTASASRAAAAPAGARRKDDAARARRPRAKPAVPAVAALRCHQCGESFPVTDFLYTKKSGLCIPCWEMSVKVA